MSDEAVSQFKKFVQQSMNNGKTVEQMVEALLEADPSLDREEMKGAIEAFIPIIEQEKQQQTVTNGKLVGVMIGGLIGALISAWVWAFVMELADAEVGYIAVGVGFAVGFGIAICGGGARSGLVTVLGFFWSTMGIVLGKFWGVQAILENQGEFFEITFVDFLPVFIETIGGFDLIWFALAYYTCWKALKD